jgi:mono/diheme cytochrome c family protein
MTISKISIIALTAIIMAACGSSKKSSAPSAAAPSIIPGDAQLTAIKAKYPDATAEQLKQGHSIFIGACTNCHGQYNIFKRSEASWLHEIDDMSPKANLTAVEKDALTKYILAMKAAQAPEAK